MNKKIAVSISIIAVLLLYLVVTNIKHNGNVPDLPKIEGGADEIIITGAGGAVSLLKKNGKWITGEKGFPADEKKIGEIEKRFGEVRLTDLISSKGYYAKYDLTPDKYGEVIIKKKGAILRKFKIGKKSSTNRHTFIRIGDKPEIYLADGTFDLVLNKSIDDFREHEMLRIMPDTVSEISVEHLGRTLAFYRTAAAPEKKGTDALQPDKKEKKGGTAWGNWSCRGYEGVRLNEPKVNALVNAMNPLKAASFPGMENEAMPPKTCAVKVKTSGKEVLFTLYKKGDGYIATTSENPYVFGVDKGTAERFLAAGIDQYRAQAR